MLVNHTQERLPPSGFPAWPRRSTISGAQPDTAALAFEVRLGLLIDREVTERDNKRLVSTPEVRRLAPRRQSSRISICAPRAASTGRCSSGWAYISTTLPTAATATM